MMCLKFRFGRATQDSGIEIRRGAMTLEQGGDAVATAKRFNFCWFKIAVMQAKFVRRRLKPSCMA